MALWTMICREQEVVLLVGTPEFEEHVSLCKIISR
jgi:hypothetical protein